MLRLFEDRLFSPGMSSFPLFDIGCMRHLRLKTEIVFRVEGVREIWKCCSQIRMRLMGLTEMKMSEASCRTRRIFVGYPFSVRDC